jgi:hypothetical protein
VKERWRLEGVFGDVIRIWLSSMTHTARRSVVCKVDFYDTWLNSRSPGKRLEIGQACGRRYLPGFEAELKR